MRRHHLAAAALAMLVACTSEGVSPIFEAGLATVNPFGEEEAAGESGGGQPITRAAVDRADVAMVRMRLAAEEQAGYFLAASENDGYVTYASSFRQTLTLNGSQITATRGFGFDLLSATSSQPDPLTSPIPPGRWPSTVTRSYEFPAYAPQGRIETFTCRFEFGETREIVILEERHRGVEVSEYCSGPTGEFESLHFADINTGFVWRSLQWTGPRQGLLDLEIVLPFTGRRS